MPGNILEFEKVSFAYSLTGAHVLKELSAKVPEGKVTAILGPNGTGKTTILMLALGWLVKNSGKIKILEKPIEEFNRNELGKVVSLVPQFEPSFFDFSILDFALLGRAPHLGHLKQPEAKDYEIAMQALEKVGMADKAAKSVMQISGGEHQLVLLARALTQKTGLILLDEPTSHLDIKNKSRLMAILQELVSDGKTIVFTTHEPDVASMIAHSVIMVKTGHVFKSGETSAIMTAENLSELYETRIEIFKVGGRNFFTWE
ncbi:MAG: ABC transporter ATP-binding protein [Candidatus Rifleibacteriota bacterium]